MEEKRDGEEGEDVGMRWWRVEIAPLWRWDWMGRGKREKIGGRGGMGRWRIFGRGGYQEEEGEEILGRCGGRRKVKRGILRVEIAPLWN